MPRPKMPPTPASSTEIKGQDHSNKLSSLQLTFELPPSAITPGEVSKSSTTSSSTKMSPISPTSTLPYLQPSETVKARRRSTATAQQQQKETFALPPPPTRSRKIIQMKPCAQDEGSTSSSPSKGGLGAGSGGHGRGAAGGGAAGGGAKTGAGVKKQPSATSAAGRKIARKTAHSLIERRRRSKMNEEFAVLKGLIPACTGEMHKLAILQASIEYVRYLEDCITKLKEQHGEASANATTPTDFRPMQRSPSSSGLAEWTGQPTAADADIEEDVEMTEDSSTPSPTLTAHSSTTSPALTAQQDRRCSSSVSTEYQTYGASPSPQVGGNGNGNPNPNLPYPSLTLASPALRPQLEIDHEVSAALLMLGSGRASGAGVGSGRGMSVRDLLSS
ncbi:hypothetical protein F5Y10DRAFT_226103 [Nemania abortiva]|nr:hypothetical protein F5Y10DRAFT_226103 [Nemania abortiva]